jgi:nucleoid-associated protein YgaU
MHSLARSGSVLLLILGLASPLAAQTAYPALSDKQAISDAEAKLAIALRSYALLDAEVDKLREVNSQLTAEKAALQAKLTEAQAAVPLAAQTVALREQLRQTQAQMTAYAEENSQLKNRLAVGASAPGRGAPVVATPPSPAPAPAPAAPAPATAAGPRAHRIVAGDTLVKISQTYYGTPNRWNEILEANREALRDEKSLVIGRTLVIP